ncbi:hypothetical protein R1sor_023601 [Riccia sorocarpa]|uniref:F-box domain-containing protein n=1 Tax=Riccia sorocarpa TaxID=122646 RepID=A0ABD3GRB8_9MARC
MRDLELDTRCRNWRQKESGRKGEKELGFVFLEKPWDGSQLMALGCHEATRSNYGAADAAWNDTESAPSAVVGPPATHKSSSDVNRGRQSRFGGNSTGASGSKNSKDLALSLAVATARCVFLDLPPALILEIFTHLDARELAVISCVCTLFRRLSSDSHGWKDFYCERWGLPSPSAVGGSNQILPGGHWRELYVAREAASKAMMGRFTMDMLHGHTAAVRCVRVLPTANLICSAGYDQTVRLWNMEEGLPVSCSRALGDTIRAITVDSEMLAVAGTEAVVRLWHANRDNPYLFDLVSTSASPNSRGSETLLYGHTGPVTCLGMDGTNLYSGSWDMSVKVWDRSSLKCAQTLRHMDWVWALAQRGRRVFSTAGSDVYSWDTETGELLRVRTGVHIGQAYAVQGTRSGHIVFSGGEDGVVRMFDDRVAKRRSSSTDDSVGNDIEEAVASWTPHGSAVYSLAFEDPWLVTASGDGSLAMIDVRQVMKRTGGTGKHSSQVGSSARFRRWGHYMVSKDGEKAQRWLSGFHQSAYSVDIGGGRVVSGGEEKIVRIWDFSQALEIEKRVQASRRNQIEHRTRRKNATMEHKGKHADCTTNGGRKNGFQRSEEERDKGQTEKNHRPVLSMGRSGKGHFNSRAPVNEFVRSRVRYVDSVSVPS